MNNVIVRIYDRRTDEVIEVPASPVEIESHPFMRLAVHKGIDKNIKWTVTCMMTGLAVGNGDTRQGAIAHATERLGGFTPMEIVEKLGQHYLHSTAELKIVNPKVIKYISELKFLYE